MSTWATKYQCELRYHWTKSVGVSRARNVGITIARHDILAFTDDDVLVTETWFKNLIQGLLYEGPNAIVTGRVLPTITQQPGGFVPSTKTRESRAVYAGRIDKDVFYTNNTALFRDLFDKVGNFDVRLGPGSIFSNAEDNDLGFRFLEAGFRIVYVPDAVLYHCAWRDKRDYLPLRWSYGRGQGAFYAKHLNKNDSYMLKRLLRQVAKQSTEMIRSLVSTPKVSVGHAVYLMGLLTGVAQWLLVQRSVRQ